MQLEEGLQKNHQKISIFNDDVDCWYNIFGYNMAVIIKLVFFNYASFNHSHVKITTHSQTTLTSTFSDGK